ncbi:unnamed protein product [Penicillium salamii]|uniref:Ubiquinone/menaquinone biosynthesis-related protein n=1 Tax=Penicillium salamii TaxID=1612424 RepID=A0A9W4JUR9_9EURO|nr:unnamed protein product [Penicillium salamii]CAG8193118.1 unnamed protein product [Penicillium salamii]CAG8268252.1 unnamed protein product [Penicillium salamii]CAG8305944.1 unnamed protein product [Penicillium salamii]CAG8360613.1 unnamed protein product [Penicillium salamii]
MNATRWCKTPLTSYGITRSASSKASRQKTSPKPAILKQRQPSPSYQRRPQATPKAAEVPTGSGSRGHGIPPRALTFLGITALTISTYCGYLYTSYRREVTNASKLNVPRDVSDRYNSTASTFDADVAISEKAMGLGKKRRDLVQMARGNVLEVSCGTGRNLPFYELGERRGTDKDGRASVLGCRSITFLDLSPQMIAITKEKFEKLNPTFSGVSFQTGDAGSVGLRSGEQYDTVLQTMGLCSMPDPAATLRHLGSITEPARGRILLLEHGRSYYDWLNRILDNLAPAHADRHGCWWNRDIGAIVRESGLEIVEEKRWHMGTTWRYVLRPKTDEKSS